MVKVYAICLATGVVGLLVVILGGAFAENVGREERDPGRTMGVAGRSVIGGLVGFGMAGLSAELSTFDLSWQGALAVAIVGAAAGAVWTRFASGRESGSDAGPI
ncbi:MAG: hypothetical protein M3N43_00825 [Actinomycetota bacterium]|nr:hypothetical protein [Actinomycetota bacterium]